MYEGFVWCSHRVYRRRSFYFCAYSKYHTKRIKKNTHNTIGQQRPERFLWRRTTRANTYNHLHTQSMIQTRIHCVWIYARDSVREYGNDGNGRRWRALIHTAERERKSQCGKELMRLCVFAICGVSEEKECCRIQFSMVCDMYMMIFVFFSFLFFWCFVSLVSLSLFHCVIFLTEGIHNNQILFAHVSARYCGCRRVMVCRFFHIDDDDALDTVVAAAAVFLPFFSLFVSISMVNCWYWLFGWIEWSLRNYLVWDHMMCC